ncbi:hypothetical protein [Enterococcus caccae]|uniref:WxL domain-containing protein n=1 Tax=Enterococcus caccae ATCC BAA-1240 TaxID=1158612 RepID=R3WA25_9ENTE|nr:hypothetical protein [Enterococcus caccae]EOL44317.1 hypothetical protein UC7_02361 [Enterococcus caccae ATCC BAA-1240]EOT68567.1 hypothetical protein I580_00950 [Enterococcus caccae ATCC BAA-1240]OJG28218.1 hypothetical protein RU98_GL001466 [Enterococcus caccae]
MKKFIKCCGVLGIIGLSLIGGAQASAYRDESRDMQPYAYIPDPSLRNQLFDLIDRGNNDLFNNYGLFEKNDLKKATGLLDSESSPFSLEGIQFLSNLDNYAMDGTLAVDSRPLSHLGNVKTFEDWGSPSFSIDYLKSMAKLEELNITLTNLENQDEKSLAPILDISVLNTLNNLKYVRIGSEERFYPTVVLKKGMNQYQLVDPVILSKQFDGVTVEYKSTDANFTYDNGIMTWKDLTSDTTKLKFSWSAVKKDGDNSYSFIGEATIPILWK